MIMTAALEGGPQVVVCASTGNTSASAAVYAAAAVGASYRRRHAVQPVKVPNDVDIVAVRIFQYVLSAPHFP